MLNKMAANRHSRYENFGGKYHCFLQLDTNLLYGIYVPMIIVTIINFAIVEGAGVAADYAKVNCHLSVKSHVPTRPIHIGDRYSTRKSTSTFDIRFGSYWRSRAFLPLKSTQILPYPQGGLPFTPGG